VGGRVSPRDKPVCLYRNSCKRAKIKGWSRIEKEGPNSNLTKGRRGSEITVEEVNISQEARTSFPRGISTKRQ